MALLFSYSGVVLKTPQPVFNGPWRPAEFNDPSHESRHEKTASYSLEGRRARKLLRGVAKRLNKPQYVTAPGPNNPKPPKQLLLILVKPHYERSPITFTVIRPPPPFKEANYPM